MEYHDRYLPQKNMPIHFDSFNSTACGIKINVSMIKKVFTVSCICAACEKARKAHYHWSAADENLARAISFAMDSYNMHIRDWHK